MPLGYLEKDWFFCILFFRFVRQGHSSMDSSVIIPPLLRQDSSEYPIQFPLKYEVFQTGRWNRLYSRPHVSTRHNSWPSVNAGHCSLSDVLSLASRSSAHMHTPVSTSPVQWSSLNIQLSPLLLCPGNSRHFSLSRLSAPLPHLRDVPPLSSSPINSWVIPPTLAVSHSHKCHSLPDSVSWKTLLHMICLDLWLSRVGG